MKILAILQTQDGGSVDQLAQRLGLASATIRRHLDILQRDGLVAFEQARKKMGRPEFVYRLTEQGQEAGRRDYRRLLEHLLRQIRALTSADLQAKNGEALLDLLLDRVAAQLASPVSSGSEPLTPEARLARLDNALTMEGYNPEIATLPDGKALIRLCNCPFRAVALCEGAVCCIDRSLIANLLGTPPQAQSNIRNGDTTCSYVVDLKG